MLPLFYKRHILELYTIYCKVLAISYIDDLMQIATISQFVQNCEEVG